MSLEKRLSVLKRDLLNTAGPSISTNRNYPFALFQYSPNEEFKMRDELINLLDSLRAQGWTILNVDLFTALIEYLEEQEEGELVEALIKEEKLQFKANKQDAKFPLNVLQNSLDTYFKDQNEFPKEVIDRILRITENSDENKTVVFLSRIGALYPFYRTSSLLRYIDKGIKVPTIVLYPGERLEKYYLSFMGEMDADRDYRPRIY